MAEHSDVVSETTNVVLGATFTRGPGAERERVLAWRHLMTPGKSDNELLNRLAATRDLPRPLAAIAQKYDQIALDVALGEGAGVTETDLLAALLVIRQLREKLQADEVRILGAARSKRVTWARIAQALGLKSRQAAERRYFQLRSDLDEAKGAPLKQSERVAYARSLRDRPDEREPAAPQGGTAIGLARRLAALSDLAERAAAPWTERLAAVLEALAASEPGGAAHRTSALPGRYADGWRIEYTGKLAELLHQARDADVVDLSGHPRLLADIDEFCVAADPASRS
ncbi:hypothetical protein ACODT3_34165 [Streptomyces sp. 4.24]|uniref:hypothetical protein n=1 Tax=Streptomyces tritrimontium TaxID=3406573 RepID=UPI003BB6096D